MTSRGTRKTTTIQSSASRTSRVSGENPFRKQSSSVSLRSTDTAASRVVPSLSFGPAVTGSSSKRDIRRMSSSRSMRSNGSTTSGRSRRTASKRSMVGNRDEARREELSIWEDGKNVTPQSLMSSLKPSMLNGLSAMGLGMVPGGREESRIGLNGEPMTPSGMSESTHMGSFADLDRFERFSQSSMSGFTHRSYASDDDSASTGTVSDGGRSIAASPRASMFGGRGGFGNGNDLETSSMFPRGMGDYSGLVQREPEEPHVKLDLTEAELDADVELHLTETETIWMLELNGVAVAVDGAEADSVRANNARYNELKKNRLGNERYVERGMQTFNNPRKAKEVQVHPPSTKEAGSSATQWDIHDVMNGVLSIESSTSTGKSSGALTSITASAGALGAGVDVGSSPSTSDLGDMVSIRSGGTTNTMATGATSMSMSMASFAVSSNGSSSIFPGTAMSAFGGSDDALGRSSSSNLLANATLEDKPALLRSLEQMERLITQNIYHDRQVKYRDMKVADEEGLDGEGNAMTASQAKLDNIVGHSRFPSLEYLWSFTCDKSEGVNVSAAAWNKVNSDVLAVSYGGFEFSDQSGGAVLVWSLKNPEHPERVIETAVGVTALDWSKSSPNLLAVGMYDGTVAVYNVRSAERVREAVVDSTSCAGKHGEPVWQIKWTEGESDETLVSMSTDGRVTRWNIKKGLEWTDLMKLKRLPNPARLDSKAEAFISRLASGLTFDISPSDPSVYVVGTEDGNIHKCSTAYNEQFLASFHGHMGPVYRLTWNPYLPSVFLSASADWTVKLWRDGVETPLLSFSTTQNAVMDVAWAPRSSTIFAYVTADGRIDVWDLATSSLDPIISHRERDRKFSSVRFSPTDPVLITGDSSGHVNVYKLSNVDLQGQNMGVKLSATGSSVRPTSRGADLGSVPEEEEDSDDGSSDSGSEGESEEAQGGDAPVLEGTGTVVTLDVPSLSELNASLNSKAKRRRKSMGQRKRLSLALQATE